MNLVTSPQLSRRRFIQGFAALLAGLQGEAPLLSSIGITGGSPGVHDPVANFAIADSLPRRLQEVIKMANSFVGAYFRAPELQVIPKIAGELKPFIGLGASEVSGASGFYSQMIFFISYDGMGGNGITVRKILNDLLTMKDSDRATCVSELGSCIGELALLSDLPFDCTHPAYNLAATIFFDKNCQSDEGFYNTTEEPRAYFEKHCKDKSTFIRGIIAKSMEALKAEQILYQYTPTLIRLFKGEPALNRALSFLEKSPTLPAEELKQLEASRGQHLVKHSMQKLKNHSGSGTRVGPIEMDHFFDAVRLGAIEDFEHEDLLAILRNVLTKENIHAGTHNGLLGLLDKSGFVFFADPSSLLGVEEGTQMQIDLIIFTRGSENMPETLNLNYLGRPKLIAALTEYMNLNSAVE